MSPVLVLASLLSTTHPARGELDPGLFFEGAVLSRRR